MQQQENLLRENRKRRKKGALKSYKSWRIWSVGRATITKANEMMLLPVVLQGRELINRKQAPASQILDQVRLRARTFFFSPKIL